MESVREPAVAGSFYPGNPKELRGMVDDLLTLAQGRTEGAESIPDGTPATPKALIAPHAGYVYSGPVAASGYARLIPHRDRYRKVVLLGPAHRYFVEGLAAHSARAFRTPLGDVPVDEALLASVLDLPQLQVLDRAHEGEHSLEVQLPFLQAILGPFTLVPLVVGDATPVEVASVLRALWGGEETLVVISSDLSHFLAYQEADVLDRSTASAIETLDPDGIGRDQACGRIPMVGLLIRAREEGLRVERVDLRNSGDTAGPRNRVVGYGSFLFSPC
jgi:AmmeMemoRadiSam system protein B